MDMIKLVSSLTNEEKRELLQLLTRTNESHFLTQAERDEQWRKELLEISTKKYEPDPTKFIGWVDKNNNNRIMER